MRAVPTILLSVFLISSCTRYQDVNSWDEIDFRNNGVICESFVLEFLGHVVMWPDLADKYEQFKPPGFYHYRENVHIYSRNPYYWRIEANLLNLISIQDSSIVAEYKLLGKRENGVLIQEMKSGEKYRCEIYR